MSLTPLILSGGSGTRLWPLSRELYPKQLLPLVGEHTMLQETVARVTVRPSGVHLDRVAEAWRQVGRIRQSGFLLHGSRRVGLPPSRRR